MSAIDRVFKCKHHPCTDKVLENPCTFTVHDAEGICVPDTCPWGWGDKTAVEFEEVE